MSIARAGEETLPDRLPSLTGIRGIAAAWVVMYHVIQLAWHSDLQLKIPGHIIPPSGWAGVDLFFILSGFMLMHVHSAQFQRPTWSICRDFFVSRFFRVFPLSAVVLFLILALVLIDHRFADWYSQRSDGTLSARAFFATLLLATAWFPNPGEWNGPVWSLSAELIGYLFFPVLAWLSNRVRSFAACIALAACCIGGVILFQYARGVLGGNNIHTADALARMAGYFSAGVILKRAALVRPSRAGLKALAGLSTVAIVGLIWVPGGAAYMPVPFASLIYSLSEQRGPVAWLLSTRVALFFGAVSFPLYLLHTMPLQAYHFHVSHGDLPRALYNPGLWVLLAVVTALSWLAHKAVEQPSHRFARRFLVAGRAARQGG